MSRTISQEAQKYRPYWLADIDAKIAGGTSPVGPGGGAMSAHALSGIYHTGQLAESQATWAGTKAELAAHAANVDAHHAQVHGLISANHTASGLTAGYVVRASGATTFAFAQLQHGDLGSVTANQHHNQVHSVSGSDHTLTGSKWALVGATADNTLGLLTPSANPGAAEAILKTDAAGMLALTKLRTPTIDTASGDLTLQPANDLLLSPASNLVKLSAGKNFQSHNYASQITGMRITNDGQGDFRYIFVDEMHAKSFIADLEQALAGGQIISKSVAMLGATFTAPAAGATATLTVRDLPSAPDMSVFQSGDIVGLRSFSRAGGSLTIANCWGVVTAYADQSDGTQTWTFTRSSAPNAGAMSAGATVAVDALVLDYGTSGNGFHEVNAIDGMYGANSPYSQIVTWTT
ncbi:MAG: hypothetical protein IPM06_19480, partial [Rhizobiales bacterium]|nr:hypothetical protein [Hyphomicrobiales bacterium]